jgi:hypothetical protein
VRWVEQVLRKPVDGRLLADIGGEGDEEGEATGVLAGLDLLERDLRDLGGIVAGRDDEVGRTADESAHDSHG